MMSQVIHGVRRVGFSSPSGIMCGSVPVQKLVQRGAG
jgi:hypothetical protein